MLRKLLEPRMWRRIYQERAGEPLIYNVASVFAALFGNVVTKIDHDVLPRQPYAFGMLKAFQSAKRLGVERLVFIEFGVAAGAGLVNMCRVGQMLSKHFNVPFRVVGFDSGCGMPEPVDYRDHPELYLDGDFPAADPGLLRELLPDNAEVIYGPIAQTIATLPDRLAAGDVIGFVAVDVDYWSSTCDCYTLFGDRRTPRLPLLPMYLDDVGYLEHHAHAGELLATADFNAANATQKIAPMNQIRNWRLFKNAPWLDRMFWLIDTEHAYFTREYHAGRERVALTNPYT